MDGDLDGDGIEDITESFFIATISNDIVAFVKDGCSMKFLTELFNSCKKKLMLSQNKYAIVNINFILFSNLINNKYKRFSYF